ncbi:serine/threonine protein kinase [Acidovorax sp. LjRoot118]|uniref:serine/threonine-protein kinase n=1 Tax=Acidovorax sp. LjRoot118 TaxID=3342256 RepID=UPI003ECDC7D3
MSALPPRYIPVGHHMAGGMGSVIVCTDTVLERSVAIKFVSSAAHRHRMADEVAALLKLRSKHVVQVYDVLRSSANEIGLVQEFINGQDLFESYAPPVSLTAYYKQLWQIASGLTDIHELGVIHRDIKPNNMKTDPEQVIKIFDFGLARDDGPGAMTQGFVGTRGFAAPELYDRPFAFTNAVDTYAFGATAIFLATGGLPAELLEQPPRTALTGYSHLLPAGTALEFAELLNSCMHPIATFRPAMREIRDALGRHILFDQHRALLVHNSRASVISAANRSVKLALGTIGSIEIQYNGLSFVVVSVSGEVQINYQPVTTGAVLPGACVIALGAPNRRAIERRFITFDISHPEIVL